MQGAAKDKKKIDSSTHQNNSGVPVVWNNALLMCPSHITVAWRLAVGLEIYVLVCSYFAMAFDAMDQQAVRA